MKKRLLLFLAVTFMMQAQSQVLIALVFGDKLNSPNVEFGLELGATYSYLSGYDDGQWANSFFIGPSFNIRLNEKWWIHPAVQVMHSVGADNLDPYAIDNPTIDPIIDEFRVERRINYFAVPIMMRYAVTPHVMLEGGIEPALRNRAFDTFVADIEEGAALTVNISDAYSRIDARILGGLAYRLKTEKAGLWISLKYAYGLLDYPDPNIDVTSRMQYWQLSFEIPIGAAEKSE